MTNATKLHNLLLNEMHLHVVALYFPPFEMLGVLGKMSVSPSHPNVVEHTIQAKTIQTKQDSFMLVKDYAFVLSELKAVQERTTTKVDSIYLHYY